MDRSLGVCTGCVLAGFILATDVRAQLTQRTTAPTPSSTETEARVGWDWAFTLASAEVAAAFGAPNWMLAPQSPAAVAGRTSKQLMITVQHLVAVTGHSTAAATEIAPVPTASFSTDEYSRGTPVVSDVFFVRPHGNQPHADIYRLSVRLPAAGGGDGRVLLEAEHGQSELPNWSFEPKQDRAGEYVVVASYRNDPNERQAPAPAFPEPTVRFGRRTGKQTGTLQRSSRLREAPTDWVLRVDYNPRSETTMAFVVMTDAGFDKADLGMMTRFFRDTEEYVAPVLIDVAAEDLFVAVDLTRWLASEVAYEQGEEIVIRAGTSERLPGFLVSRTAIGFTADSGFVSESPFSGTAVVSGEIDGSVPAATDRKLLLLIVLVVLAFAVAATAVLRRRARSA